MMICPQNAINCYECPERDCEWRKNIYRNCAVCRQPKTQIVTNDKGITIPLCDAHYKMWHEKPGKFNSVAPPGIPLAQERKKLKPYAQIFKSLGAG